MYGSEVHSSCTAGTTSVCPDKIIPLLFELSFPLIVENKLACEPDLLKVLKDVTPTSSNFFSQYLINSRFEVPDTV